MNTREIETALGSAVERAEPIGGGDINNAYRVRLADKRDVFVKAHAQPPSSMFEAEAAGLGFLQGPVRVPRVLAASDGWLALEWLELRGRPDAATFGRQLAALHQIGAPGFGLDAPNYLATLPQDNTPEPDWPTFYVERRCARCVVARSSASIASSISCACAPRCSVPPSRPRDCMAICGGETSRRSIASP